MDLTYTDEQDLFRRSVRDFVRDRVPPDRLAEIADGDGWDPALWKEAVGLGLAGVSVPEELGGAGMGFVEEAIAAEELGKGLFPGPWLGSVVLARPALADAPDLLAQVTSGEAIATVAPPDGRHAVDVAAASVVIVPTLDRRLVAVEAQDVGVRVEPTVDATRRVGTVRFPDDLESLHPRVLASGEAFDVAMTAIRTRALAGLAAEAVGVAERVLEIAVDYAKERRQFGRPIGAYQAVSHQLADTFMEVELSRSLALRATLTIAEGDPEAGVAAAAAKAFAADAAVDACERAIQVHGGVGFTWEHVLHRYYKRALWIRAFLASGRDLRAEVAARLLDGDKG